MFMLGRALGLVWDILMRDKLCVSSIKTIQVQKANEYLEVLEKEKSDAENLLKSANAINQSRRNLEQNIKFLEDKENLHNLGIAFGISGFVLDTGIVLGIWN